MNSRVLLTVLLVTGCSQPEPDKDEQIRKLAAEKRALENQIEEARIRETVAAAHPDKRDFDQLESDSKTQPLSPDFIRKYPDFEVRYPASPLVQNARKRYEELTRRFDVQIKAHEKHEAFQKNPVIDLLVLTSFPEKYLGQRIRVTGTITNRGFGFGIHDTDFRSSIRAVADEPINRYLSSGLQGQKAGLPGSFELHVSRDDRLQMVYRIVYYEWAR
jgi:hypothetical protein